MNEVCVTFGVDKHLVGTLTLPDRPTAGMPAMLLMNSGVIHRIGPHRINVKLARALAGEGMTSLRFDLSGQGDSRLPNRAAGYETQSIIDIRAAMDHVQRTTGIERFAIAGICSAADHGLVTALEDPRVIALWMMDGYAYPTRKTRFLRYWMPMNGRIVTAVTRALWSRLRAFPAMLRATREHGADEGNDVYFGRQLLPRSVYAQHMRALVDRGVAVFLMYSGSLLDRYNYAGQLRDGFGRDPFVDRVRCDFVPDIDHTVTTVASQRRLVAIVCDWVRSLPPSAAA